MTNTVIQYVVQKSQLQGWDGKLHAGIRDLPDGRIVMDWVSPWENPFDFGPAPCVLDNCMPGTWIAGSPGASLIFANRNSFQLVAKDCGEFVQISLIRQAVLSAGGDLPK